jgi:predicted ATPase/class 3 adenylate cyclase
MVPSAKRKAHSTAALPTGTVTFLFSDIEGSTQRWEQYPEATKAAVARHEQLMSAAIKQHGGYIFKSMGDAFCAAFPRAPDAIAAAIDAQLALAKEDFASVGGLCVRMGLHTGHAEERNADYFGPAVNRVARLMSIGHGGQVLLSQASYDLSHTELPSDTSLTDLGSHRLKDLAEPEHVWQLTIAELTSTFPPLRSLDALPNNLPAQRTTLVGREHDIAEVRELLRRHRLVTLVGSGGVGKTRVALQVGADLLDQYPDGAWFVDFSPITDSELVSSVVAQVLGMQQQQGRRVDESIPPWLKRKKLLLIFDNCEHLLEAIAALVAPILDMAHDVRILNTSRQALAVTGEAVHRLPSLAVPSAGAALGVEEARKYGGISLFVDRATLADSHFVLTDDNAPIVADICRRLDGIPLAIELAAARVKVLSIPNLAHRLDERFKILTGGSRDVLPRQKTLSALIDWSYDLLNRQEQTLFNRVGIFAGGFSLDAAMAVCGGDGLDEIDLLDLLSSLTDKSLVVADTSGEQERYSLLESTRAYALEKLSASGERDTLARRHAEYFRNQAEAADECYGTGSIYAWMAQVETDLDNYRAALEWALTQGKDPVLGGAIAGALGQKWFNGGLTAEGSYWIVPALERINESEAPQVVARLLLAFSNLSSGKRKYETAERSLQLYQALGDGRLAARARFALAYGLYQMGRMEEAEEENACALTAAREWGDKPNAAHGLNLQASIGVERGDLRGGCDLFAQALAIFEAFGSELGIALVQINMAETEFAEGRPEDALHWGSKALETQLRGKNEINIAISYANIAAYRIALGNLAGARESAREGLRRARQAGTEIYVAIALQHLALILSLTDDSRRAAQLLGYVDAQYKVLGVERETTEKWGYDKLMATLREKLSDAEIEKLAAEGATWSEDQAVEEALKV